MVFSFEKTGTVWLAQRAYMFYKYVLVASDYIRMFVTSFFTS